MVEPGRAPALHEQLRHTSGLLQQVRGGASLTDALARVPPQLKPGCQALAFHVMRWKGAAEAARRALAPKAPPPEADALLTCALALLWPAAGLPYSAHTVVDEAVKAARRLAPRQAGFINAVLRNFLRGQERWVAELQQLPLARLNHPDWWVTLLQRDWPEEAEAIMAAAQVHPPMTLRASECHGGLRGLLPKLEEAGWQGAQAVIPGAAQADQIQADQASAHQAHPHPLPQGWTLQRPVPVHDIPGFAQGHWSVQDAAAQWAAPLLLKGLKAQDGGPLRLLDACAAPGGKTAHLIDLLESTGEGLAEIVALDADAQRLKRVHETLERTRGAQHGRVTTRLQAVDARRVADWWDGQPFDGILLDAPCSASGIVRRHPDARWLRRPSDIPALVKTQAELLDALWPLVRPGGRLLYATCSVFKDEGRHQIEAFLQRQGLGKSVIDPASPGHLLPLTDNLLQLEKAAAPASDGFFYALLHKP